MTKQRCITLTPHIPVDEANEIHAYATLLLYSDWKRGESNLLRRCSSAVERLQEVWETLPVYVTASLNSKKIQEQLFAKIPIPNEIAVNTDIDDEEMFDFDRSFRRRPPVYVGVEEQELDWTDNNFVLRNTKISNLAYLNNFIDNRKEEWRTSTSKKYCMTDKEFQAFLEDPSLFLPIDDNELKSEELDAITMKMNAKQKRAFDIVTDHISNEESDQMIMLLTGPGGSGTNTKIKKYYQFNIILL